MQVEYLEILSREYLFLQLIIDIIMMRNQCGVPLGCAFPYAGTDVKLLISIILELSTITKTTWVKDILSRRDIS